MQIGAMSVVILTNFIQHMESTTTMATTLTTTVIATISRTMVRTTEQATISTITTTLATTTTTTTRLWQLASSGFCFKGMAVPYN